MSEPSLDRRALLACLPLLAGCATLSQANIGKVTATITTDLSSAANLYAIAKGIGEVALLALGATPAGAAITAAIAIGDAAAASIANTSAAAATASALLASTNAILAAGAPAIKAVANAA